MSYTQIGVCSTSMVFSNRSSSVFIWLMSFMRKGHWPPENGSRKLLQAECKMQISLDSYLTNLVKSRKTISYIDDRAAYLELPAMTQSEAHSVKKHCLLDFYLFFSDKTSTKSCSLETIHVNFSIQYNIFTINKLIKNNNSLSTLR